MFYIVLIVSLVISIAIGRVTENTFQDAMVDYRRKWEMRNQRNRRSRKRGPAKSLTGTESFFLKIVAPLIISVLSACSVLSPFIAVLAFVLSLIGALAMLFACLRGRTQLFAKGCCWFGTIFFSSLWFSFAYINPISVTNLVSGFVIAGLSTIIIWACGFYRCKLAGQRRTSRR